jgi:putative DNA primase/helicase
MDQTGNRRYLPVKVGKTDLDALRRDRDQLLAEAAYLESQGASIVLPKELWAVAAEEQAARCVDDLWRGPVEEHLVGKDRVHSIELLTVAIGLNASQITQATAKRLRTIMDAIGGWTAKRAIRIGDRNAAGYERLSQPTTG